MKHFTRPVRIGHIIGIALVAPSIAIAVTPTPTPSPEPVVEESPAPEAGVEVTLPTYSLPPCESDGEDESINCYWDASEQGDGSGTDFIQFNGVIFYP